MSAYDDIVAKSFAAPPAFFILFSPIALTRPLYISVGNVFIIVAKLLSDSSGRFEAWRGCPPIRPRELCYSTVKSVSCGLVIMDWSITLWSSIDW